MEATGSSGGGKMTGELLVMEYEACGGGDPSLLSSVPGRPSKAMAEKAGTWVGYGFVKLPRASGEHRSRICMAG
jgi:hypothetical protein